MFSLLTFYTLLSSFILFSPTSQRRRNSLVWSRCSFQWTRLEIRSDNSRLMPRISTRWVLWMCFGWFWVVFCCEKCMLLVQLSAEVKLECHIIICILLFSNFTSTVESLFLCFLLYIFEHFLSLHRTSCTWLAPKSRWVSRPGRSEFILTRLVICYECSVCWLIGCFQYLNCK